MSTDLETLLLKLAPGAKLRETPGGLWLEAPDLNVTAMAASLHKLGARLSTMTGLALQGGETELIYHYVLETTAFNWSRLPSTLASLARTAK